MNDSAEDSNELRASVIATARSMNTSGINVNKSGNVSVRCLRGARPGFLLTPSGVPYEHLDPQDIVFVDDAGVPVGRCEPSSEWRFHAAIHAARAELIAIVHTHSPFATALACQGLSIPAFHYMVAVGGGLREGHPGGGATHVRLRIMLISFANDSQICGKVIFVHNAGGLGLECSKKGCFSRLSWSS